MDTDLQKMTRDELIAEVQKLRDGIRKHRDSNGHELCWHHPSLWGLLPEKTDPIPSVPEWSEFMSKYRCNVVLANVKGVKEPWAVRGRMPSSRLTTTTGKALLCALSQNWFTMA